MFKEKFKEELKYLIDEDIMLNKELKHRVSKLYGAEKERNNKIKLQKELVEDLKYVKNKITKDILKEKIKDSEYTIRCHIPIIKALTNSVSVVKISLSKNTLLKEAWKKYLNNDVLSDNIVDIIQREINFFKNNVDMMAKHFDDTYSKYMNCKSEVENLNKVYEFEIKDIEEVIKEYKNNFIDLDEAPGSYKDIKTVMENQKDLVEVIVELKPIAVVKG